MWNKMKKCVQDLLCENGEASLTRIMSLVAFIAFLLGSFFLMFSGKSWPHYDTFATMTVGAGAGTQLANKFINSKYNSDPGRFPAKNTGEPLTQGSAVQKIDKAVNR